MASFTDPCPKVLPLLAASSESSQNRYRLAYFPRSDSRLNASSKHGQFQQCNRSQSDVFKVAVEKTSNSASALGPVQVKESGSQYEIPDASSMSAFMNQVSDLIKLVDSRDIVELQLKQMDCEIHLRKKEALPQPSTAAPVVSSPPPQQFLPPPQMPPANIPAPTSTGSAPPAPTSASTPTAPARPKSSHPPFKCPMAGNFYRASAPGAPPFVKVGDKVQKGQILCIIEAMKLMNEIESDQAGTVVEILVDDGKPVSIDTPLFLIEP